MNGLYLTLILFFLLPSCGQVIGRVLEGLDKDSEITWRCPQDGVLEGDFVSAWAVPQVLDKNGESILGDAAYTRILIGPLVDEDPILETWEGYLFELTDGFTLVVELLNFDASAEENVATVSLFKSSPGDLTADKMNEVFSSLVDGDFQIFPEPSLYKYFSATTHIAEKTIQVSSADGVIDFEINPDDFNDGFPTDYAVSWSATYESQRLTLDYQEAYAESVYNDGIYLHLNGEVIELERTVDNYSQYCGLGPDIQNPITILPLE